MRQFSLILPIVSLASIAVDGAVLPSSNELAKRSNDPLWPSYAIAHAWAVLDSMNNPVWTKGLDLIFGELKNMVLKSEAILDNIPFVGDPQDPNGATWNRVQNGWMAPIVAVSNDAQTIGKLCHQYTNSFGQSSDAQTYMNILRSMKANLTNTQLTSPAQFTIFTKTVSDAINIYDNYFATTEAGLNSQIKETKNRIATYKRNMDIDIVNLSGGYSLTAMQVLGDGTAAASIWGSEGLNAIVSTGAAQAGIPAAQLIDSSWDAYDLDSSFFNNYTSSLNTLVQKENVLAQQQTALDLYIYVVEETASVSTAFDQIRQGMLNVIDGILNYYAGDRRGDPPVEYAVYNWVGLVVAGHNILENSCDPFIQWGQNTWTWVESHI